MTDTPEHHVTQKEVMPVADSPALPVDTTGTAEQSDPAVVPEHRITVEELEQRIEELTAERDRLREQLQGR